jgi:DNA processing protein
VEAAEKSGTLHTARFALEQGKDVFVIPGNITSPTSVGTNNLIKAGAIPVTTAADILSHLGLAPAVRNHPLSDDPEEQAILDLIQKGVSDATELQINSGQSTHAFNQHLTMLELQGVVRPLGNNQWSLS